MAKNEADVKRDMIARIKEQGGYGRRFEDQYAVGFPDTIMIPDGGKSFFCEVKIIRTAGFFGVTPRQLEELDRIARVSQLKHSIPCMIGYGANTKRLYIGKPAIKAPIAEMAYAERPWDLTKLLNDFATDMEWKDGIDE